jgi:hypothetical protein
MPVLKYRDPADGLFKSLVVGVGEFLKLAGGVMTGPLTLHGAPTDPLHAATKGYVDKRISGGRVVATAVAGIVNVPHGLGATPVWGHVTQEVTVAANLTAVVGLTNLSDSTNLQIAVMVGGSAYSGSITLHWAAGI